VDATALALQALIAAKADGAKVPRPTILATTSWLSSVQRADGAFSEDASAPAPSANSPGLAATALFAAGHVSPRLQAAGYVFALQLTGAFTPAKFFGAEFVTTRPGVELT
jgi:hypothetical protein